MQPFILVYKSGQKRTCKNENIQVRVREIIQG